MRWRVYGANDVVEKGCGLMTMIFTVYWLIGEDINSQALMNWNIAVESSHDDLPGLLC